jgi:glutamine---fructose-6-phosphate transaminase (isomerizing)
MAEPPPTLHAKLRVPRRAMSAGDLMAAEMAEQPQRIAALVARRAEIARDVRPLLSGAHGAVVVARGSSDHAATTGRYLLEMAMRRPVASASPSVVNLYGVDVDFSGYVVVGVSQSGRTPEIADYLAHAGRRGARTIAITNDPSSPLARVAAVVVELGVGEERAVPATKTVTAELVAFALVAAGADDDVDDAQWEALPAQAARVLEDPAPMVVLAGWLATGRRLVVVARGPLSGAAAEIALKLEETSSLLATAFGANDLRHGPIALASSMIPVLALAHPGPAVADVLELCEDLSVRGADVRVLGPVRGAAAGWDPEAPEQLAPVLAVLRGQQLAHGLSLLLGLDPDRPAGLTKVTTT